MPKKEAFARCQGGPPDTDRHAARTKPSSCGTTRRRKNKDTDDRKKASYTVKRRAPPSKMIRHPIRSYRLGGHLKTGHLWTGQNRPFRMAAGTM
jgi:hypothetical protein